MNNNKEKTFHECTSNCRRNGCLNCEHGYDEEHTCPTCDKISWSEQFDKKFIIPESHFGKDFYPNGYEKDIWGKYKDGEAIKQFIKTTLNDMLDEIVGEDLPRYEQQDFLFHRDEYNWGYNDCIKQIKAKGLKYISK